MKAILEFNLDEQDDIIAHKRCVKATDMALAIWEIVHNMKRSVERDIESKNLDSYQTIEELYKKIYEKLEENAIYIDELIT